MNVFILISGGLAAGGLMGYLYFRGLWWTVEHMDSREHPHLMLLFSFFIRSALIMAGFYLLLSIRWELVALALAGFIAARYLLIRSRGMAPVNFPENREDAHGI